MLPQQVGKRIREWLEDYLLISYQLENLTIS